jgi:putative endonuclease
LPSTRLLALLNAVWPFSWPLSVSFGSNYLRRIAGAVNYCYVLLGERDRHSYLGSTEDLRKHLREHHAGRALSTAYSRLLRMVYYEACLHTEDARRREGYLKSG